VPIERYDPDAGAAHRWQEAYQRFRDLT
jgi:hypothetical protein